MGPERPFHRQAIDHFGAGPAFRTAEDDGRPAGPARDPVLAGMSLDGPDLVMTQIQGGRECLVSLHWVAGFDEMHLVAVAFDHGPDILVGGPSQNGGAAN